MDRLGYSNSIFRQFLKVILLCLPLAGIAQPLEPKNNVISVTVNYPSQISAGANFSVTATLRNTSSEPILATVQWILRPGTISGSHASSYRIFSYPLRDAGPFGRTILEPGIPYTISLREFFYESEDLVSGKLIFDESTIIVSTTAWQREETTVEPMLVAITHGASATRNDTPEIPERLALERREIGNECEEDYVIYDPNSGLEWLPLSRTHSQPLISVLEKLAQGSEFEGFRVANLEEVRTLFLNAIYTSGSQYPDYALFAQDEYQSLDSAGADELLPAARNLQRLFGVSNAVSTPENEFHSISGVLIGTKEVPDAVLESSVTIQSLSARSRFYLSRVINIQSPNATTGVWLLRESEK